MQRHTLVKQTHYIQPVSSARTTQNNDTHPFSTDDVSVILTLPMSNQLASVQGSLVFVIARFVSTTLNGLLFGIHIILWHIEEHFCFLIPNLKQVPQSIGRYLLYVCTDIYVYIYIHTYIYIYSYIYMT